MALTPVTAENLPTIIEQEVARSIGHWDGTLAAERKQELDYYLGKPFGNEIEGESQVVSTDVADTVESLLPQILRIFTSSDDVVRFDPNGPEDEEQAKQQTDVTNYVFYRQNNGFLVLYEWFKDALIQKNGVVKYWWEDKQETTEDQYYGLSEGQFLTLQKSDGVEIVEQKSAPDPMAAEQMKMMRAQIEQQAPPEVKDTVLAQFDAQPVPQIFDVKYRVTKDLSKLCITAIPPEEFGISAKHNCVSIQETPFCYHRSKQTISSLRANGCPEDILADLTPVNEPTITPESLARDRFLDLQWRDDTIGADDSTNEVWVTEGFIRIDYDGDGIAELRHFIMPGRSVWINEPAEHINFAALTPIIMPHRWTGRSASELVMDIQFTKSVLWRQMLNNLYLTNNPRKAVLSTAGGIVQANLDDLLVSRAGGIMREYVPNAIRNEEVPFVAGAAFPMLEYMDGIKENRTGNTRYNQGTDSDSLNKTARGIALIQSAGQQRLDLIARIFAETGVKDLMRGIAYMLAKYSSKKMTMKLRNNWVDIDPREWKTQFNMMVNVGLGTGNRDVQLQHLTLVHQSQMELMESGRGYMVSDENLYNVHTKRAEAMGFKHPELFITDPKGIPEEKKKAPPPPEMVKIQADAENDKAKNQLGQWKEQFNARANEVVENIKAHALIVIAEMDNKTKKEIAAMQIEANSRLAVFDKQHSLQAEAATLDAKRQEVDGAAQALDIHKKLASTELSMKIDKAISDVTNLVAQYENKMVALLDKAEAKATVASAKAAGAEKPKKPNGESDASNKAMLGMHAELMGKVTEVLGALSAKRNVRLTLPDGGTASAEVSNA